MSAEEHSQPPPAIEVKGVSFTHELTNQLVLRDVNLKINKGEFVLLAGPSGCGKTTLLKCLVGLIPHFSKGTFQGSILVDGLDTRYEKVYTLAQHIGIVFQNPEDNIFSLMVEDELAFGPENLGLTRSEIVERVEKAIVSVGISNLRNMSTYSLSGGQKQKVAVASCLAMLPGILIMDEPTTDLDPISSQEVVSALEDLRRKLDITIVIVEHEPDELVGLVDRLIVMDQGRIAIEGNPREVLRDRYEELQRLGLRIPQCVEIVKRARLDIGNSQFPVTPDETKALLTSLMGGRVISRPLRIGPEPVLEKPVIDFDNVSFGYNGSKLALDNIDLKIYPGEFVAIIGANGSGKSTLAKLTVGLIKPKQGVVTIDGLNTKRVNVRKIAERVGYVFQNPENQLFCNTVWEEVAFGLKQKRMTTSQIETTVQEILSVVNLQQYKARHPATLSRGEKRRLAVATALPTLPRAFVFDEPTTGQDYKTLYGLLQLVRRLNQDNKTAIVMITHDMEVVPEFATRILVLNEGRKILDGPPDEILSKKNIDLLLQLRLKPPPVSLITRDIIDPPVHTMHDFLSAMEERLMVTK